METPQQRARRVWMALAAALFLVVFCVLFVDRPASTWAHEHFHRPAILDSPTHLVDPLRGLAALCLIVAAAAAAFRGWRPGERGRTVIAASFAILVSVEIKDQLKYLFGRTWPESWVDHNPSWIDNHVYGFNLLHGGAGWASFPSGHTTQAAALAAVIWLRLPRLRWLSVLLVALVAIGLWGSDYHFVGDIVAGGFLGTACGWGIVALVCGNREDSAQPRIDAR